MPRGKGKGRRSGPRVCEEEEEYQRQLAGEDPRAQRRLDTDSDESEEEDDGEKFGQVDHDPVINRQRVRRGQNANVGLLPPSDSEDSGSEEEEILPYGVSNEPPKRSKADQDEPDPEQVHKDMERLRLIKEKREKDRLERIAKEGWDRFAPISETNKPPGGGARPEE
uniref:Uncharacterized protein n=1 Tax=Tetraselmis sp. GSL018 TaxID=582737 RepID=A0A061R185_9CHLO|eukprot:CAMPEP_0177608682 /NCGR_PEP_ID=MMETSP0419_2-20121207/18609_1 /TAXON_ID=582737 /ORGANISM="Tetraselmis sp., Strain GSL018" /LENGTH=166 /DNA_ID=CAMNT_0019103403 /DNA_START=114 /DNA_END=614 /DNA_ORIENTATION=+